ncbi:MAG TPA: hypothetical protein PKD87_15310 [Burkholderiaceae bacterium]|nr:hypothetical protein [Burkholderiaceae bacterium]
MDTWQNCCGVCQGGKRPCPVPDACQRRVDHDPFRFARRVANVVAMVILALILFITWTVAASL